MKRALFLIVLEITMSSAFAQVAPEAVLPIRQQGYRDWEFQGGETHRLQLVLVQGDKVTFLTPDNSPKQVVLGELHDVDQRRAKMLQQALRRIKNRIPESGKLDGREIKNHTFGENVVRPSIVARFIERDELPDGVAQYYFEDQLYASEYFQNGIVEGAKIYLYPSGKVHSLTYFTGGAIDGKAFGFYESGALRRIFFWNDGTRTKRVGYYATGERSETTPMVGDAYHGESIHYLRDGSAFGRTTWVRGKVESENVIKEVSEEESDRYAATNLPPLKALWIKEVEPDTVRPAIDSQERTWTSRTGTKFRAILVSADNKAATIRYASGKRVKLSLSELSDNDRKLVKKLTAK